MCPRFLSIFVHFTDQNKMFYFNYFPSRSYRTSIFYTLISIYESYRLINFRHDGIIVIYFTNQKRFPDFILSNLLCWSVHVKCCKYKLSLTWTSPQSFNLKYISHQFLWIGPYFFIVLCMKSIQYSVIADLWKYVDLSNLGQCCLLVRG